MYQQHMLLNIRKYLNVHLTRIMSIVFASLKYLKLPIGIKIPVIILQIVIPRRSRRDIVLASSVRPSVRPSVHSVRPHFLSVQNHISVPIGQI